MVQIERIDAPKVIERGHAAGGFWLKGKLPYFCWYPADFDVNENVRLMNLEEIGLYAVCLNHAWMNGSLPSEPLEIARAMKVPKGQFLRAWPRVLPCFQQDKEGRWTNPRQERERVAAKAKSEKAAESAHKKWGGDASAMRSHTNRIENAMPRVSNSDSVSDSGAVVGSEEKKDGKVLKAEFDEQWQHFRRLYGRTGKELIEEDFAKAHFLWRVLDFAQRTMAIANIAANLDAGQWRDPQWIPLPENYLRGEYKRKVVPRSRPEPSRKESNTLRALETFKRERGES